MTGPPVAAGASSATSDALPGMPSGGAKGGRREWSILNGDEEFRQSDETFRHLGSRSG
jgi:hypothetical protein